MMQLVRWRDVRIGHQEQQLGMLGRWFFMRYVDRLDATILFEIRHKF
jgi:hypothetical protein